MNKKAVLKLIIAALIIAAAFFVYRLIFVAKTPVEEPGVVPLLASASASKIDDEFLRFLQRLKNIELDVSVFNHPVWVKLENFRRELGTEPHGRLNPFAAPGPNDSGAVEPSATTTDSSSPNG